MPGFWHGGHWGSLVQNFYHIFVAKFCLFWFYCGYPTISTTGNAVKDADCRLLCAENVGEIQK
jgi:hypothetical protein